LVCDVELDGFEVAFRVLFVGGFVASGIFEDDLESVKYQVGNHTEEFCFEHVQFLYMGLQLVLKDLVEHRDVLMTHLVKGKG